MRVEEFNNVKYYIGQSARENWQLLDDSKRINRNYIWFHLDSFPSPYVVMYKDILDKNIDCSFTEISINDYLQYGAELCKKYSKYKFLKDIKIMYVPLKKLLKTKNLGEVTVTGKAKILKCS